jgi:hypothetical protein
MSHRSGRISVLQDERHSQFRPASEIVERASKRSRDSRESRASGRRSANRGDSQRHSFVADECDFPPEKLAPIVRSSRRAEQERFPSHAGDAARDEDVGNERRLPGKYGEPVTGYCPEYDDGGLCSEDERDVKMLQKKRRQRARRNMSEDELLQRIDEAQTDLEYSALVAEYERRCRVSRISRFFGGPPYSSRVTRQALDAAGWSRRK